MSGLAAVVAVAVALLIGFTMDHPSEREAPADTTGAICQSYEC